MKFYMCLLLALLFSVSVQANEISEKLLSEIKTNAEVARTQLNKHQQLDYSKQSVKWVDDYLTGNRDFQPERMIVIVGAYLGEAIIQNYGGEWIYNEGEIAVKVTDSLVIFPFIKVLKSFMNGADDSIYAYFSAIGSL